MNLIEIRDRLYAIADLIDEGQADKEEVNEALQEVLKRADAL